jgi:hypothetical protein
MFKPFPFFIFHLLRLVRSSLRVAMPSIVVAAGIGSTTTIIILLAALGLSMAVGYFLYQLYAAGLISFAVMLVLLVIVALLVQLALGLLVINRGTLVALKKDSA